MNPGLDSIVRDWIVEVGGPSAPVVVNRHRPVTCDVFVIDGVLYAIVVHCIFIYLDRLY